MLLSCFCVSESEWSFLSTAVVLSCGSQQRQGDVEGNREISCWGFGIWPECLSRGGGRICSERFRTEDDGYGFRKRSYKPQTSVRVGHSSFRVHQKPSREKSQYLATFSVVFQSHFSTFFLLYPHFPLITTGNFNTENHS